MLLVHWLMWLSVAWYSVARVLLLPPPPDTTSPPYPPSSWLVFTPPPQPANQRPASQQPVCSQPAIQQSASQPASRTKVSQPWFPPKTEFPESWLTMNVENQVHQVILGASTLRSERRMSLKTFRPFGQNIKDFLCVSQTPWPFE